MTPGATVDSEGRSGAGWCGAERGRGERLGWASVSGQYHSTVEDYEG